MGNPQIIPDRKATEAAPFIPKSFSKNLESRPSCLISNSAVHKSERIKKGKSVGIIFVAHRTNPLYIPDFIFSLKISIVPVRVRQTRAEKMFVFNRFLYKRDVGVIFSFSKHTFY